jgi:hypothetical protein
MDELFFALADPENAGHPAGPILAYAYCPRAAGWLRSGPAVAQGATDPPERLALRDIGFYGYRGLKKALSDRGFGAAWDAAVRYIERAEAHRRELRRRGVLAPGREESPEFLETLDFGLPAGIDRVSLRRLGGAEGLRRYLRAWVFLVRDWAGLEEPPPDGLTVAEGRHYLRVPGAGQAPFAFPLWTVGSRVGWLASGIDPVIEGLAVLGAGPRTLYVFSPDGSARPAGAGLPAGVVAALAGPARSGPYPPLRGLWGRAACDGCAFVGRCYGADGALKEAVDEPA